MLAIHLAAFAMLYLGTFGLLERASAEAGATAARFQLDDAVRQMPFLWMGSDPKAIPHLAAAHQSIGLHLYRRDGTLANAADISPDPAEIARVRDFLAGEGASDSWVARESGKEWVRGVVRITASERCVPCHAAGATLGAATMKVDFSAPLGEIRQRLRNRTALLLGAWVTLLAGVTLVVQRTVDRSGARLRADLESAADAPAAAPLPLDPVTAEVHRHLRELLLRQRERESHVAARLAHADQLASLGKLAAGLAHEIKNPLAGIQGALELLREESGEEATTRLYGEMLAELERVNGILQRLLESGRPAPLRLARTDLARLLAETVELLRPSLRRRRVELRAESGPALPEVQMDTAKMRQVLVNLIQNAAEAMPESGGWVAVRASRLDPESIVVTVEDDGPGIPTEHLSRLFEPFFTTKFAGTGLGLAISKAIVEQHGGRIEVSSEPGRGATFLLFLPQPAPVETAIGVGEA
jgi:signal transduction histidine kinase